MSGLRSFEVTKLFKIKHKKIKQMPNATEHIYAYIRQSKIYMYRHIQVKLYFNLRKQMLLSSVIWIKIIKTV